MIISRNIFVIFLLFFVCSCKQEYKKNIYTLPPFEFTINENSDTVRKKLEQNGVSLYFDDSYCKMENGVHYYYFDYSKDSLDCFFELFFLDNRLSGVKEMISCKTCIENEFKHKIYFSNNSFVFSKAEQYKEILIDTGLIKNESKYLVYVRTKELEKIMK